MSAIAMIKGSTVWTTPGFFKTLWFCNSIWTVVGFIIFVDVNGNV